VSAPPEPDAQEDPSAQKNPSAQQGAAEAGKRPFHFWRLVATVSSLGWSMALPIVGGALLGSYLDKVTGQEFVWTVGLLFGGVAIAFYNLYHTLYKETIE
jgi:predicted F0F1-ATPase subunit